MTRDLQLLAQVSSNSDDSYFQSFMVNLLSLFATDRKLLEMRGSLIIRQLCVNLNPDRIYRTLAEILERDEVMTPRSPTFLGSFWLGANMVGSGVCVDYGAEFA